MTDRHQLANEDVPRYHVLAFQLNRRVEPHPFVWQVAPACYAHDVLDDDYQEVVILPGSCGMEGPRTPPSEIDAADARAELGPVKASDEIALIFRTEPRRSPRGDHDRNLATVVRRACLADNVIGDDDTVLALTTGDARCSSQARSARAEARSRANAAAMLAFAAEHDWYPTPTVHAYEQYLFRDAHEAITDLRAQEISIPDDLDRRPDRPTSADSSTPRVTEGCRVRLVSTSDPYAQARPGTHGTVDFIDDLGTLHVLWDDESTLGLVPGEDRYKSLR